MITEEELKQLQSIAKANDWPIIEEVGTLSHRPVYQLRHPNVTGKVGYPHLYTFGKTGIVELDHEQIIAVVKDASFQRCRKRIQ